MSDDGQVAFKECKKMWKENKKGGELEDGNKEDTGDEDKDKEAIQN